MSWIKIWFMIEQYDVCRSM